MYQKGRTEVFKGLNTKPYLEDGEIREMKNLCDLAYPYMSSRKPICEYTFEVEVPGALGDGIDAVIYGALPEPDAEYEAKIYKLVPNDNTYKTGEFYYYNDGDWRAGIYNSNFKGYVDELPDYPEGTINIVKRDSDGAYNTIHDRNGEIYKCTSQFKEYSISDEEFVFTKTLPGETNKYDVSAIYPDWRSSYSSKYDIGKILWVHGTNVSDADKGYYKITYRCTASWVNSNYSYSLASQMPASPENGTQVRYIGNNTPVYGETYICERDFNGSSAVYFMQNEAADEENAEKASTLPSANAENYKTVYMYTGNSTAGYYICEESSGAYTWTKCEHPYVLKSLTLNDYLEKYFTSTGKGGVRVLAIHEHSGKMAALIENGNGEIWLYYDHNSYKLQNISKNTPAGFVTCGQKLCYNTAGGYLNTKSKSLHAEENEFNLTIQTDEYRSYTGAMNTSSITRTVISFLTQNKNLAETVCEIFNEEGIQFIIKTERMAGEQYAVTSGAASIKSAGYWTQTTTLKMYRVTIPVEDLIIPPEFKSGDEIVLMHENNTNEKVCYKNRLWSYNEENLISTVLDVVNQSGNIDWQTTANAENDNGAYTLPYLTGGNITGIAALKSAVVCFKRNHICTLQGNTSATFLMETMHAHGLEPKNAASIQTIGGAVYYLSDDGIYAFYGGNPINISEKTDIEGRAVSSGTDGRRYYLCVEEDGKYKTYVYDTRYRLLYMEEDRHIESYTCINGKMYFIEDGKIKTYGGDEKVEWLAAFEWDEGTHRMKKYRKIAIRGDFKDIAVYISSDGKIWHGIGAGGGKEEFPVSPFKCERLWLKIKGKGGSVIKSIEREFEVIE